MKKYFTLLLVCWLIFHIDLCFAQDRAHISVVFSSGIAPYQQCYAGFDEFFKEKQVTFDVSKYNLNDSPPK